MKSSLKKCILWALAMLIPFATFAQEQEEQHEPKHKIGVALSGGGALGYAHIGVLDALEDYGIEPTIVAGTSMGAIVGVLYAAGYHPEDMLKLITDHKMTNKKKIMSLDIKSSELGLFSKKYIASFLEKTLPTNSFDSLPKPFYCAVTNLMTTKGEIISSGDRLQKYTLASMSIPVLFQSVVIDSMVYIDGGITNNLPARSIRDKCDILISVDVNPYTEVTKLNTIKEAVMRTMTTLVMNTSLDGRACSDYIVDVYASHQYSILDFAKYKEIYKIGYDAGMHFLLNHPELLKASGDFKDKQLYKKPENTSKRNKRR
jgi:NTE family protein